MLIARCLLPHVQRALRMRRVRVVGIGGNCKASSSSTAAGWSARPATTACYRSSGALPCSSSSSTASFPLLLSPASRYYSIRASDDDRPKMFQLEHIQRRLELAVPMMFFHQLDFTFYRDDVVFEDDIFHARGQGLTRFRMYLGTVSVGAQVCLPIVKMTALSIVPILEDGTVRLRWRVEYVSLFRAIMNPRLFGTEGYKKMRWYDGYTIFWADADGLVYRVKTQRTMPDENGTTAKTPTQKIAEKIAAKPAATNCVRRDDEDDEYRRGRRRDI